MKAILLSLAGLLALSLSGCSPSESVGRTVFENQNLGGYDKAEIAAGRVKLQSFRMLQGQNLETSTGQKRHILKYEAVIHSPVGTSRKTGELLFEMTDKGWRGPDGKFY